MEEVAKDVELFQKKLQKYTKLNDKKKLIFYLSKLKSLPIKVSHLEATGVGKSVNALRHNEGDVGEKARHLVGKWKKMVTEEENQQDTRRDSYKYTSSASSSHKPVEKTPDCSDDEKLQIEEVVESSPQLIDEEYDPKVTVLAASNSLSSSKYALPASCSDDDAEEEKYDPITSKTDYLSAGSNAISYEPTQIGNSQKEAELEISNNSTSSHKSKSSSHKSKKHKSHSKEKESSSKDKSKHKSKKSSSKSKEKSSRKDKKKDKERSSHKHSKDDKKNSELSKSDVLDTRLGNQNIDETSNEIKHGRDKEHLVNGKRKVPDTIASKSDSIDNHSQPNSSKKDKSKQDSEHKSKKRKIEDVDVGFGAALLNISGSPKKKKSKSKNKEKGESKSSSCKENIIENKSPIYEASTSQSSLDLPSLDPNYKPLPRLPLPDLDLNINGDCSPYDNYDDDDLNEPVALTQEQTFGMYAKNKSRRQIYTGKITGTTELPSLMTLCIRSLQENISALEYTGGVPYDILKPVIERATPDQLFALENYNPYLLEDTNSLWEGHCKKKFKNSKTEDMETYRDLYIRLTDERTQKLENLTKNLQNKFVTRPDPRRSTVLAFVDSVAKPPKSVARAQAKFGTGVPTGAPAKTSKAAEIVARKNAMNNVQRAMNSSANARTAPAKKTKAPLMAKTMQFYKKTFRR